MATWKSGEHLRFDGRQGRHTVVATNPAALVEAVSTAYQGDARDVRSYRKIEPLTIERFEPGAELLVGDVRIERDGVTLEFDLPDGSEDTTTSLRVKWPLPLSSSFSERLHLEDLMRRFVDLKQP